MIKYFTIEDLLKHYLQKKFHILSNPNSIYVDISPYPYLMPALSSHNEKYVRSEPNDTPTDNLLRLPRS